MFVLLQNNLIKAFLSFRGNNGRNQFNEVSFKELKLCLCYCKII